MPITAKPEILTPRSKRAGKAFDDQNLDLLSHLLDDFIHIPGTPIRFGLDGIVGFIPGIGDILGGLASTIIIVAAWSRGVPPAILARMVLNVAIETGVGTLPVVGNFFDIAWRANRRNYALLTQSTGHFTAPSASQSPNLPRKPPTRSWLLIAVICLILAGLMLIPLLLGAYILLHLKTWLFPHR